MPESAPGNSSELASRSSDETQEFGKIAEDTAVGTPGSCGICGSSYTPVQTGFMLGMCCEEPLNAILHNTPSIYAASTMQPPQTEPETEPSSGMAADPSRDFTSASNVDTVTGVNPNENIRSVYEAAPGDSFEPASGSSDAEHELSNDFVSPPATVVSHRLWAAASRYAGRHPGATLSSNHSRSL